MLTCIALCWVLAQLNAPWWLFALAIIGFLIDE